MATKNNSLKRRVAFFPGMQEMREEMERVWKDFFEKNPDENEQVVRRWIEKRLRGVQDSKDQHEGSLITAKKALRK